MPRFIHFSIILVLLYHNSSLSASSVTNKTGVESRNSKLLPLFQIVKFPNDPCNTASNSSVGTCYTPDECSNKKGQASGSCASGFGVCCVFTSGCWQTTYQNNTYLKPNIPTTEPTLCTYTICPMSGDVCRMRFDFIAFDISGPYTLQPLDDPGTTGHALGACSRDTFSISSPGHNGSPVICGKNTNQHMFADVGSNCVSALFTLSQPISNVPERTWNIKVSQYTCAQSTISGYSGCLQYFTGLTNVVKSFNFDSSSDLTKVYHLSNQNYQICIRRELSQCKICYSSKTFGLSGAASIGAVDVECLTDYVTILGGIFDNSRFCGRQFALTTGVAADVGSVCTAVAPYVISFKTNDNEDTVVDQETVIGTANSGFLGFSLDYSQSCK